MKIHIKLIRLLQKIYTVQEINLQVIKATSLIIP